MSEHDLLVENFAAPYMMSHFGSEAVLRVEIPGNKAFDITAILSTVTIGIVQDEETGELKRQEQRTAMVMRSVLAVNGVEVFGLRTRFTDTRNNDAWNYDQDTTTLDEVWITIGLIRKPQVRKPGPIHATI